MNLKGKTVLVTAGPTRERIDPVRYLSNFSSGKMGYAIAERALLRGARVLLVTGPVAIAPPDGVQVIAIESALDLLDAMQAHAPQADIVIQAAAVADYRPAQVSGQKIKKKDGDLSIPVERTADILGTIGPKKTHQFLCGFSMETRDMVENSTAKLTRKNLDMVVANNLKVAGAGFGVDTNVVTFITPDGTRELPLMSKADVADAILDEILKRRGL